MKSIKILSTLVVIASILTACEKNNSEEPNFDSLKDQAYVVGLFSDIYDQVEEASGNIEHNNTNH